LHKKTIATLSVAWSMVLCHNSAQMSAERPDPGAEKSSDAVLEAILRRKLGRFADYAVALAGGDAPLATAISELERMRNELNDVLAALTGKEPGRSVQSRLGEFPDTPFYNGILPRDMAAFDELENDNEVPDGAVRVFVIADHYLYWPDTQKVMELFGDPLYVFDALFRTRGVYRPPSYHMKFGFRHANTQLARSKIFRIAADRLNAMLTEVTPEGFTPILTEGNGAGFGRMLNPGFVIVDKRGDPAFAHLIPEEPPAEDEPVEGMTVAEVVRASGASDSLVRKKFQEILGDDYNSGRGVVILPTAQAKALLAQLEAERAEPLVEMPEGYCLVRHIADRVGKELGIIINTEHAATKLAAADLKPVKLNLTRAHATQGGIWCIKEEGAYEALLESKRGSSSGRHPAPPPEAAPTQQPATAEARPDPAPELPDDADEEPAAPEPAAVEPAPASEVTLDVSVGSPEEPASPEPQPEAAAEPESPRITLSNTAGDIVAFLTSLGHTFTEQQVVDASRENDLIKPQYDRQRGEDVYSHRSARRIIEALTGVDPVIIEDE
jgi:hypothetical protein